MYMHWEQYDTQIRKTQDKNLNKNQPANSVELGQTARMYRLAWLYTDDKGFQFWFQKGQGLLYFIVYEDVLFENNTQGILLRIIWLLTIMWQSLLIGEGTFYSLKYLKGYGIS